MVPINENTTLKGTDVIIFNKMYYFWMKTHILRVYFKTVMGVKKKKKRPKSR